ncbi:MAG TPA: hypothetical protein VLB76_01420 [Thermoanaerobaculia bacterium]|jgi:hypothetical protein|nr:hypothetical protein [Thermoanaerobaculia bacterium]
MKIFALPFLLAAVLPASAFAAPPAGSYHRIELKPAQGKALPYTLEVPQDWQVRQVEGFPGLWIGPADAKPPEDPRLIWVRGSQVALAEPEKIVANIKENDAAHAEWSASRVEARTVGGVRCVLVQMDSGEGDKARASLTLKVPFQTVSVDLVASAAKPDFPKMLPMYEKILFSVQPAAGSK